MTGLFVVTEFMICTPASSTAAVSRNTATFNPLTESVAIILSRTASTVNIWWVSRSDCVICCTFLQQNYKQNYQFMTPLLWCLSVTKQLLCSVLTINTIAQVLFCLIPYNTFCSFSVEVMHINHSFVTSTSKTLYMYVIVCLLLSTLSFDAHYTEYIWYVPRLQ